MFPENDKQQESTSDSDESAVVVDLTETDPNKQAKPLTADKAGEQGGDDTNDDADAGESRVNGNEEGEFRTTGRKDFDKRLKREMRAKIQARANEAAATEEAERLRAENEQLRRAPAVREEAPNTADIDTALATAQTKLAKAMEDGESATAAALQVEISSLTSRKEVRLAAPRRVTPTERVAPAAAKPKGPTATGKAFLLANDSWWNDPDQAAVKSAVISIDNQLLAAGSDPNSESHYERIAKRAKAMGLKVKIKQPFDEGEDMSADTNVDLDDPPPREQRRTPPQGGNGNVRQRGNSELRDARANKVVLKLGANLDGPDAVSMRVFKLDPANPAHVRAFAKSRQERVLQEGQS